MDISKNNAGRFACRLLARLTLLLAVSTPAMAQVYDAIDSVDVSPSPTGARIDIRFNAPTQYLGHTPKDQGRQLFIDVRLTGVVTEEMQYSQEQQLQFQPSPQAPLTLINYRSVGDNNANIELDFSSAVRFSVKQSSDFRGITVVLITDASTQQEAPPIVATPQVEKQAESLMQSAKKALIDERNFSLAGTRYQQVLDLPENTHSKEALEFLGLAYERQGKRIEARKVYEGYLVRYPAGEGRDRVSQRLMSLVTATQQDQKKLRVSKQQEAGWEFSGSLSQSYLHNSITIDDNNSETTTSAITTNLNLNALNRTPTSDTRLRLAANHFQDLTDTTSTTSSSNRNDIRFSSLYAEHRDRDDNWWVRAGRQRSSRDGVLSRFDGVKLGYEPAKKLEVSVVAGYPVNSTADSLNTNRSFAGMALDFGPYADHWELSLYGLEQQVDTLVDRRAIGSEVRYFNQDLTVLGMLDYDALYSEVNIGMLLANWTLKNKTSINASADIRKLPTLSTSNALQGQLTVDNQAVVDIAQLRTLYTDDVIYQLARDRTAEATTMTLGISHPFSEKLRLSTDLSMMNISETPASGGVAATPAIENEYSLNLQMIGTGVLNGDDLSTLGLRYASGSTSENVGLYVTSRMPLNKEWRIYPRMMIDQRQWKNVEQSEVRLAPSLRFDYRMTNVQFDAELGGEWVNRELTIGSEQTRSLFGSIGYHFTF